MKSPPKPRSLTRRQTDALAFIREQLATRGLAPTLDEIGRHLGVHRVTALEHVRELTARGWITTSEHRSRSIQLVATPTSGEITLPLAGLVAAGSPIEAIEDHERIDLREMTAADDGNYLLKVRGDSMIDDQIQDGDYVVIRPQDTAENGDTVVALIDGSEATLKRFYRAGATIRLEPRNPRLAPLELPAARVQLRGIVKAVIRRY